MTHQDYLSWLDSEIQEARKARGLKDKRHFDFHEGREIQALAAREKFLTIQFPSQLTDNETEDKSSTFTDGLE